MIDFDYAAPETWHSRILGLQMRAEPHKVGGVVYVPEQSDENLWFELFGTPEKAARTMAGKCGDCCECVIADYCEHGSGDGCLLSYEGDYDELLEWLRGDS